MQLELNPMKTIGSYEILEEIGRGGLGVVYRGLHAHLRREVAVKVLHPTWTTSMDFVERFREEGRVLALLEHPNILRVYDAGEADGQFFLATQFIEGRTLETLMRQPAPLGAALNIVSQIGRALSYAHSRGVIHRDVKPANVMVSPRGTVTLMDFGLARLRDSPNVTMPGVRMGTPYYMSPEQILGKPLDGRTDLYSLAVILHQLITGALPFPGPSTDEVLEGHVQREPPPLGDRHPAWLDRVVSRALAKDPADRFPDVDSLLRALECWGDEAALDAASIEPQKGARTTIPAPSALPPREGGPVKAHRTALALDVAGSSRMKEPGLTHQIQTQFTYFRDYVRGHLNAHSCVASSWSGDGLLALFARPSQGAACSVAILDGLAEFNERHKSSSRPIRLRLGVHHGSVTMSDEQPLGEVMSRTLDMAGHLQKISPENSAMVSEDVYFALPDNRRWRSARSEYSFPFPFPVYQYVPPGEEDEVSAAGQAPAAGPAVLRVEVAMGQFHREYEVRDEALIGRPDPAARRSPDIDVRQDDAVSRRHARLFRKDGTFYVEDLDSANGTTYNGRLLRPGSPAELQPGDTIELGELTLIRVLTLSPDGA